MTYIHGRGSYWFMSTFKFRLPRCCFTRFITGFRSAGAKRPLFLAQARPRIGFELRFPSWPWHNRDIRYFIRECDGGLCDCLCACWRQLQPACHSDRFTRCGGCQYEAAAWKRAGRAARTYDAGGLTVSQRFMRRVRKD